MVERAGPEMLRMLQGHMMGDNRVRSADAVKDMIARSGVTKAAAQIQLI